MGRMTLRSIWYFHEIQWMVVSPKLPATAHTPNQNSISGAILFLLFVGHFLTWCNQWQAAGVNSPPAH